MFRYPFKIPTIDDPGGDIRPFLVLDATFKDRNHAIRGICRGEWDMRVLAFEDRSHDAGSAAVVESGAVRRGKGEDFRDAVEEDLTWGDREGFHLGVDGG